MTQKENQNVYQFGSEPRTVASSGTGRQKYRDPYAEQQAQMAASKRITNVMWDRRVVRGNTYAAHVLPAAQAERIMQEKEREEKKKQASMRRQQQQAIDVARSKTPEPVEGRLHMEIQTEQYLEEILDRPIEKEADSQTDAFMDRPPSPVFVPKKSGLDKETQIYEGELFHFDLEVDPILEVLVGKTLEQSMLEVMEEDEFAAMKAHTAEVQQQRNAELAEIQRLEAAERRRFEEKERRKQQEKARLAAERRAKEKVVARSYAKDFVQDLQGSVFSSLAEAGFFFDPVEREIETSFMAHLEQKVVSHVEQENKAREMVDALLQKALSRSLHRQEETRQARHARIAAEEERKRRVEEERRRKEEEAEMARLRKIQEEKEAAERAAALAAEAAEAENADGEADGAADAEDEDQ